MFEGKSIFPLFAVDRPMPAGTQPPLFTVGKPKPEAVPAEVAAAVEQFVQAARSEGYAMASGSSDRLHFAQSYTDRRRTALDAVILKHLRGEA